MKRHRLGIDRMVAAGILVFAAALAIGGSSEYEVLPDFAVPAEFWTDQSYHPVGYLKAISVPNPKEKLPTAKRKALVKLFRAAHYACRFKYRQSYMLATDTPVYQLLTHQYPGLTTAEGEGGRVVPLGAVVTYLEGLPSDRMLEQ